MSEKAHFITPVEDIMLTPYPGKKEEWIVRTDFYYYSAVLKAVIEVPRNFITDLNSTPRPLWWLYPPCGKYTLAVVIHDRGYWLQDRPQKDWDMLLREAIQVCGDSKGVANNFYAGVRIGGWAAWNNNAKQDKSTGFVHELPDVKITVPRILLTTTI